MICLRPAITAVILTASGLGAFGQTFEAPVLGYVFDEQLERIRPIWGTLGAATLGDPYKSSVDILAAAISPRQDYVLIVTGDPRTAAIFDPRTGLTKPLAGVRSGVSLMALSPAGAAAILYCADSSVVQIVTGLPSEPIASKEISVADAAASVTGLAVSDDGAAVLLNSGTSEAIAIETASQLRNRITLSAPVASMAFLRGAHDAVLASAAEAVLVRDVVEPSARIALGGEGLSGASLAAVTRDGGSIVLANPETGKVRIVNLKSSNAAPVDLDCQCVPSGIYPVKGTAAFRLTNYSGDPLPVLDAGTEAPRMLVVPPVVDSVVQP